MQYIHWCCSVFLLFVHNVSIEYELSGEFHYNHFENHLLMSVTSIVSKHSPFSSLFKFSFFLSYCVNRMWMELKFRFDHQQVHTEDIKYIWLFHFIWRTFFWNWFVWVACIQNICTSAFNWCRLHRMKYVVVLSFLLLLFSLILVKSLTDTWIFAEMRIRN